MQQLVKTMTQQYVQKKCHMCVLVIVRLWLHIVFCPSPFFPLLFLNMEKNQMTCQAPLPLLHNYLFTALLWINILMLFARKTHHSKPSYVHNGVKTLLSPQNWRHHYTVTLLNYQLMALRWVQGCLNSPIFLRNLNDRGVAPSLRQTHTLHWVRDW